MSKKRKEVFNEDFLKIKSNIPSLKKGESAASFKKRVEMWTSRTGLEFPDSAKGLTGLRLRMTKEGQALSGQGGTFGNQDYSAGYSTELNKLVQSNMRRFDANQKADKLRIGVPESGMSDIRGQEGVEADAEKARQDKILFGEDLMKEYGPGGAKADGTDTFDAGPGQTDLQIARAGSFNPDTDTEVSLQNSLKVMQGTDNANALAGNSTMADQLRETTGRLDQLRILQEGGVKTGPQGMIKTDKGFASVRTAQGNKALKKALAKLKAQKLAQLRIG